jgi:hypothetical protein
MGIIDSPGSLFCGVMNKKGIGNKEYGVKHYV